VTTQPRLRSSLIADATESASPRVLASANHAASASFARLDAAKPARRSPDVPIADLLRECHLTAEAVRDITPDVLDGRLRALAVAITGADRLRRALVAAELKHTAKVPAAIVTAALDTRDHEAEQTARSTITLTDDEPASDPVNGATLLDETAVLIRRHVVMTQAQADACALWTGAAHAIDGLQRMPMLLLSSNAPECGKTTAATLLSGLVPRPVMVSNLTPAVLFRLIDRYQPTLIADEVDAWLHDEQSELRGVFNAAHWRTGAVIPRCVGDDHDVRLFNVFGAKVIAMIGRPSATILSRSITITLHRKTAGERVELLREDLVRAELGPLRQQWRRWTVDHLEALRVHDPAMPADLPVNRASDNWRPLLSIADLAGGSWPARARAAATELSGVRVSEDEPVNVALLVDVQAAFRERDQPEYLSSEEIIVTLKARAERPWADWNQGRGITAAQLAHRLRGFSPGPWGLRTRKTRLDASKTAQRWHRADFADAWSRYVTADPEQPEQTNESGPQLAVSSPEHPRAVPGQEMAIQPMLTGLVPGVPAAQGENGHDEDDRWTL
jgi:putative DNA primase/helicase